MLIAAFFTWWYGQGWALVFKNMQRRLHQTSEMFSVIQLLRTLFSPWRRTITYPGAGLNAHMQALADNAISRLVGFTARMFVLFAAAVTVVVVALIAIVEIIAWPLVPVAIVAGIIRGLMP